MSTFIKIDDLTIPGEHDAIYQVYLAVKTCINYLAAHPEAPSEVVNIELTGDGGESRLYAVRLTAATRLSAYFDSMDDHPEFLEKTREQQREFMDRWIAEAERQFNEGLATSDD